MRTSVFGIFALCALGATGCDKVEGLRAFFHPKNDAALELAAGKAGLRLEVTPPRGLSILVDDVRVANQSPYENKKLTAGTHMLSIRAMGHHPFSTPIELVDGEVTRLSISLRPRKTAPAP